MNIKQQLKQLNPVPSRAYQKDSEKSPLNSLDPPLTARFVNCSDFTFCVPGICNLLLLFSK